TRTCVLEQSFQLAQRVAVLLFAKPNQGQVEARLYISGIELEQALELTPRFVEHGSAIEGHAQVAAFSDLRVLAARNLFFAMTHAGSKTGLDEAVQCLANIELGDAGLIRDLRHTVCTVEQCEDALLFGSQVRV